MINAINPYIAGDPVGNSLSFVGREDILRDVIKVLRSPNQNTITLFGQRRIGKTSMLQFLKSCLHKEGIYQTVYFDLQDKAAWPLPRLLSELARAVADELSQPHPSLALDKIEPFGQWMQQMLAALPPETSIVLLFDEFDVLADPQAGSSVTEFFPYLRGMLSLDPARLKFVFVLGRNITDLGSFALSVFKGTASKRVSLLSQAETFKLIHLSEQNGSLFWSTDTLSTIWELTHGHPYLTQALCSQIWETAYDDSHTQTPKVTLSMIEAATIPALDASRNMLEWLWNGLGPAEKVISAALAGAGHQVVDETRLEEILRESGVHILIRELQNAPQQLEDWDILEKVDGGYVFRVELLRRWITKYHPLSRTQDEIDRIQPAAENLYLAAESIYQQGDLTRAEDLLQQAIGINPYHLKATERMAEIFIAKKQYEQARELLEKVFEIAPNLGRQRLVQVYLLQVSATIQDEQKFGLYDKILAISPNHPQALAEKNKLILNAGIVKMQKLVAEQKYEEALQLLIELSWQFPDSKIDGKSWQEIIHIYTTQNDLLKNYQSAKLAIEQKKQEEAINLLTAVIQVDPHYKDATALLYQITTGENLSSRKALSQAYVREKEKFYTEIRRLEQENQELKASVTTRNMRIEMLEQAIQRPPLRPVNLHQPFNIFDSLTPALQTPADDLPLLYFNPQNPFNQFKMLIWIWLDPQRLQSDAKKFGMDDCLTAALQAIHHLIWLPLVLIFLSLSFGRFKFAANSLPSGIYPLLILLPLIGWLIFSYDNIISALLIILPIPWGLLCLLGLSLSIWLVYQSNTGWLIFALVIFFWGLIATTYIVITGIQDNAISKESKTLLEVFTFFPIVFSLLVGYFTLSWQGGVLEIVLSNLIFPIIIMSLLFSNAKTWQVISIMLLIGFICTIGPASLFYLMTSRWMAANWVSSLMIIMGNLIVIMLTALLGFIVFCLGYLLSRHIFMTRLSFVLFLATLAVLVFFLFF